MIALAALVAALVIAYTKSETFRKIVDAAFEQVTKVAEEFAEFFTETLPEAFEDVLSWVKKHWPEIAVFISGPFAPLVLLATDAFGIRSALIGAFEEILDFVKKQGTRLYNAGREVGEQAEGGCRQRRPRDRQRRLGRDRQRVDAARAGRGDDPGLGQERRHVAEGRRRRRGRRDRRGRVAGCQQHLGEALLDARDDPVWGASVGGWIKNAVRRAIGGIGEDAWKTVNNIWTWLSERKDEILGWGKSVGLWLKRGIVNGLKGLGDLLKRDAAEQGAAGPGGEGARAEGSAEPGRRARRRRWRRHRRQARSARARRRRARRARCRSARGCGARSPGSPRPSRRRRRPVEVSVFIGETELRGIVRTEVRERGQPGRRRRCSRERS